MSLLLTSENLSNLMRKGKIIFFDVAECNKNSQYELLHSLYILYLTYCIYISYYAVFIIRETRNVKAMPQSRPVEKKKKITIVSPSTTDR